MRKKLIDLTTSTSRQKLNYLFKEIRQQIDQSKVELAISVNSALTMFNWNVGRLIHLFILKENRAEYGKEILATVSPKLTFEFGQGYNPSSLNRMLKLNGAFPNQKILATLSQQLTKEFGTGYSFSALKRMVKLYSFFRNKRIVATAVAIAKSKYK